MVCLYYAEHGGTRLQLLAHWENMRPEIEIVHTQEVLVVASIAEALELFCAEAPDADDAISFVTRCLHGFEYLRRKQLGD